MPPESGDSGTLDAAERHYLAGRFDQAEALARRLTKRPRAPREALLLLARVLIESGKPRQAIFELERAINAGTDDTDLQLLLHNAWVGCGDVDRALEIAQAVAGRNPDSDDAMCAIASLHFSQGRLVEAEEWYGRAHRQNPASSRVITGLARVMGASLRGRGAVELLQGELRAGRRAPGIVQQLALQIQYVSGVLPAEILAAQQDAGRMAARAADGYPPRLSVDRDPDRKLTVGLLSPDFRQHSCAHFIEPVLAARDPKRLRIIAYSSATARDAVTERLRGLVDAWRDVAPMREDALAALIASDKVDIAIDLAGHTSGTRIGCLSLRPAPVTATYLGYPSTTAVPGVDYKIVDAITDPPGVDEDATEGLVRLDPCFLCYRPLSGSPDVGPLPSLSAGQITFGSFNVLDKVSDETLELWSGVLGRVPESRLLLKSKPLADDSVRARVRTAFESRGIDPRRLELIGWTRDLKEHLALYRRLDVALDTSPYNGTTTTCEALWMGVPVVTLRGRLHAGRVGSSLLTAVGLSELIATTSDEFIECAAGLGANPERISGLRAGLRARMTSSPLRDERGIATRFESLLRGLWRSSCQNQAR